jgi:hypothetical protein
MGNLFCSRFAVRSVGGKRRPKDFSAKGAVSYQPGASPQDLSKVKSVSAEGAIHSRSNLGNGRRPDALDRAFSAWLLSDENPGASPQAADDVAPLALNR